MVNSSTHNDPTGLEIAVIGMAGRFPGARNIDEFWQNLQDGIESISFFSDQELTPSTIAPVPLDDPNYIRAGGVLADIELFDASLFGFNPREAEMMDPQQRLFLECAWEALESAGHDPDTYPGLIGVYAGVSINSYLLNNLIVNPDFMRSVGQYQLMIANDKDYLTTQVSYKLNLEGPSVVVQTACSTSLVAVHLACQGLLSGACDMALAGGVSIKVPQKSGRFYQEGGIHSPDGHCRAFDAQAQGTVGGNGLGIVVLKRLADALTDGDYIRAVIKGSAINNDGALKVGYTAPRVDSQAAVIRAAQLMAGVELDTITYVETHGTGTTLGDPIEIAALTQAFREETDRKGYCAIGSVKTNIGHLDTAAGVAGLIKTVLSLEHKRLPPSLNFKQPNPKIDFDSSPFFVNTRLTEWKANGAPLRAGVSSFGIGGTNVHTVLEQAPASEPSGDSRPWKLLLLSAGSSSALETAVTNLAQHLKQHSDLDLADVAFTLQVGRKVLNHRQMLVCHDCQDAVTALETRDPIRVLGAFQEPEHRPVVFMFPGQGAQYVNMALGLYQTEPTFRGQVDHCAELLQPLLGMDLRSVLYPDPAQSQGAADKLQQTWLAQPALFVIEYALAKLWMEWGVRPEAMIGHSIGEYVAACLAGVLSLEDALALVAARGQLMQQLPPGAMLSVPLSEEGVRPFLNEQLALAAINGPSLCVVSGPIEAIDALEYQLSDKGQACRRLHTSHAFHSDMMDPIVGPFFEQVKRATLKPPQIPFISNVTGTWITEAEATAPGYWARHLRQTVRFADGIGELLKEPARVLVEVGPGQTLSSLTRQHPDRHAGRIVVTSVRHPQDQQPDAAFLLGALGRLWLAGVQIEWPGFYAHERRCRLPLPAYPFERQRYWIEPQTQASNGHSGTLAGDSSYKKQNIADWFYVPCWKPIPLPLPSPLDHPICWLVFSDACGIGDLLAQRLEQKGQRVVRVRAGSHWARLNEHEFTLNPRQRDDYFALLSELGSLDELPARIIHLWGITPSQDLPTSEFFEDAQYLGFYSLIFLAQALGSQSLQDNLQIWTVTNNLQAVAGEAFLCPEKATVLGPLKVIPQEHPHIICYSIDIVLPEWRTWQAEQMIDQLLAEVQASSLDTVIAYRDHQRLVQTFEAIKWENGGRSASRLRDNGVYLITGGLEGIGFALAEAIAQSTRVHFVLVEDTNFPSRDHWEHWLAAHQGQDSISRRIRNAQDLERAGSHVLIIPADTENPGHLQTVVTQIDERLGQLHGVIYVAGARAHESLGTVQNIKLPDHAQLLRAGASDLMILEQALQGRTLDFCLLQSSLSAVLGGLGAIVDTAAHLFTEAFAQRHNRYSPVPWTSIHWDAWQWGEEKQAISSLGARLANLAITVQEGAIAFQCILSRQAITPIIISTGDLQVRLNQWIKLDSARDSTQTEKSAKYSRPNLPTAYVAPRDDIEEKVASLWQEMIGVRPIGIHDNFFELGGHSLLATQLISRLRHIFHTEIPLASLFEEPTVANLASKIAQSQGQGIGINHSIRASRSEQDQATQTLENLVALSDAQVDALLADLLSAPGGNK